MTCAGISAVKLSSKTGTDGLATVSTDGGQPHCGKYLTNLAARCTPAPPTGGKRYETKRTRLVMPTHLWLRKKSCRRGVPCFRRPPQRLAMFLRLTGGRPK